MTPYEKTVKMHGEDRMMPVEMIVPNADNPNKMKPREFNLLIDNLQRTGLTEAICLRDIGDGKFRVYSGHHRYDGAVYLEWPKVPYVLVELDDEEEIAQLVRMNNIRGKLDPAKFMNLYSKLNQKYTDEILQDMLGFADDAEFQRLIKSTKTSLPKEMHKAFDEGAKEVKTIDDLAKLLNTLFAKYGNTLPYQFMFMDHAGKDCIWVRINKKTYDALMVVASICREQQRTMDDLLGFVVQSIAKGEQPELIAAAVAASKEVVIPKGMPIAPTAENIAALSLI